MTGEKCPPADLETCNSPECSTVDGERNEREPTSAFKQLGILDQFLALWIFIAMAVGIILGNFVPNTSKALDRGKFVGVSIPIGKGFSTGDLLRYRIADGCSCRTAGYDVSHPVQGPL